MNTNLIDQLASEISLYESRIATLKQAHTMLLNGSPVPVATLPPMAPSRAVKARKRAPGGHLEECLMKVITKEPITNEQMRVKLAEQGYAYSLVPAHVSKALTKLVKLKQLKGVGARSARKYFLP